MLHRADRKQRHREKQRRYEARQKNGVALFPVPLSAAEIDVLIELHWLPEGGEADREAVGAAVAALIASLRTG
jgi:hypothetical protein